MRDRGESGWARWSVFPAVATLTVLAAHAVHTLLAWRWLPAVWQGIEPWVPSLVPARAGYTVPPWPTFIWLALVATFLLTFSVVAVLAAAWTRGLGRGATILWLWAGALAVAVLVVGMRQIGEWWLSVRVFGGLGGSHLRGTTLPALAEAVRWGVVWGWAPAVLCGFIPTPRTPPERGPRRRARSVFLGGILVVASLASGGVLATTTSGASLSARTEVAQPQQPGESDEPDSAAGGTGVPDAAPSDPPADVAGSAQGPFAARCDPNELELSVGRVGAATGSRHLTFTVTNVGTDACALRGIPDLVFADTAGNAVRPVLTARAVTTDGTALDPGDAMIEPGRAARSDLAWRAPTGRPSEFTILLAAWPGAERTPFVETLDVADGAEMLISPWYVDAS